jgi:tetratricopeptide (TPR) repeat protein
LSYGRLWTHDLAGSIEAIDRAAALGPNYAEAHASRGYILSYASRPADAIESLKKSMRLDPQHPRIWLHFLAHAYFVAGNYQEAAALLERRIRLQPETDISRVLLASCQGHLGREADARSEWNEVLRINPGYSVERKARVLPYENPADWERFVDGLRKADITIT